MGLLALPRSCRCAAVPAAGQQPGHPAAPAGFAVRLVGASIFGRQVGKIGMAGLGSFRLAPGCGQFLVEQGVQSILLGAAAFRGTFGWRGDSGLGHRFGLLLEAGFSQPRCRQIIIRARLLDGGGRCNRRRRRGRHCGWRRHHVAGLGGSRGVIGAGLRQSGEEVRATTGAAHHPALRADLVVINAVSACAGRADNEHGESV